MYILVEKLCISTVQLRTSQDDVQLRIGLSFHFKLDLARPGFLRMAMVAASFIETAAEGVFPVGVAMGTSVFKVSTGLLIAAW